MKLKSIITFLTLFVSVASYGAKGVNPFIEKLNHYLYPENAVSTPSRPYYTPDGDSYLQLSSDHRRVIKYSTATGKQIEVVFDCAKTRETTIESVQGFSLSPDGSRLLLYRNYRSIYRRSFTA